MKVIKCTSFCVFGDTGRTVSLVILREGLGFKNIHVAASRVSGYLGEINVSVGKHSDRTFILKVVKARKK